MSAEIKDSNEWKDFEQWLTVAWERSRARPNDREWAIRACLATAMFIERIDAEKRTTLAALFSNLAQALMEMEMGVLLPLLQPKKMPHRPPDSFERRTIKEVAAVAMSLLMERRFARQEAGKVVADCLCDCGIKTDGRRQLTWKTVASWRDQTKKGPMVKWYTQRLARERREFAKDTAQASSRAEVRRLLVERLLLSIMKESPEIHRAVLRGTLPAATKQFAKIVRTYFPPDSNATQPPTDSK
jgi:hypothetical protein